MPTIHPAHANGKTCSKCTAFKPAADFGSRGDRYGYLKSICRACNSADSVRRYHADPQSKEKARLRAVANYRRDPVLARQKQAAWRAKNPKAAMEIQRRSTQKRKPQKAAYRKANAERIKASAADYRKRRAAEIKAYGFTYYRKNKAAAYTRIKACVAKNPALYNQLHKAAKHRRKVRLTNNGPVERFTDLEIFERDNWACKLCGLPVDKALKYPSPMSASLDHILPIAKGGGHTRANAQLAHLGCNSSKKDRISAA